MGAPWIPGHSIRFFAMKGLFLLVSAVIAAASAVPIENHLLPEPRGWYVPNNDGKFTWITKEDFESEAKPEERKSAEVKFFLYTKSNPNSPKQLYLNDGATLSSSFFTKSAPTRVIIHGWQNDYKSEVNTDIRNALLNARKYNVLVVDWSDKSVNLNYASSRNAVPNVGLQVAQFLDFLSTKGGMSFKSLMLIGHSLGAHVAGFAGKQVTRGKVNTIIGLDPAYPLFSYSDCSKRLCTTDATYVESIQTCGGMLGFLEPIGKAAFYPNGGKAQPGCGVDLSGSCAHSRSYQYFAEAIQRNSFRAVKCDTYNSAVGKKCGNSYGNVRMGTSYGNSGAFYVPVNSKPPYGMG